MSIHLLAVRLAAVVCVADSLVQRIASVPLDEAEALEVSVVAGHLDLVLDALEDSLFRAEKLDQRRAA